MTTPDPLEAIEVVRGLLREHHSVAMQRMADKLRDALPVLRAERDELAKAREENERLKDRVAYYEEAVCMKGNLLALSVDGTETEQIQVERVAAVLEDRETLREENARLRELEVGYDRWKVAAEKTGQHLRLARAELEKARYSAGQFCGAHIGKKYAECPVCSRVERDDRVHELEEEVETLREENARLLAGLQGAAAAFEQAAEEPRALAPQPEESDAE
jgi:hypothetical protein